MGIACDHSNGKILVTRDDPGYKFPFINDGGWQQLASCNDGTQDMAGINIYNGNFIYGIDTANGNKIKARPWDGSNCSGTPELIDGSSGIINVNGKDQFHPYMAPDGSGLFYSQRDGVGNVNLYFAPIQSTPVCGDGNPEGTEQCDNGSANTDTPCDAPYDGSCNYCDTNCNEHTVQGDYCDDGTTNGPETCDDGAALNGQVCTPSYDTSCDYCSDTCTLTTVQPTEFCGDNTKNGPEACDGNDLGYESCSTLGFPGGTLNCDSNCNFDTSACEALPTCGDGTCDGSETCQNCADDCGPCCGNGDLDPGEACDDGPANTDDPPAVDWKQIRQIKNHIAIQAVANMWLRARTAATEPATPATKTKTPAPMIAAGVRTRVRMQNPMLKQVATLYRLKARVPFLATRTVY